MTPDEQFPFVARIVQELKKGGITDPAEIRMALIFIDTYMPRRALRPEGPQETI